jgi:hypothetical protein
VNKVLILLAFLFLAGCFAKVTVDKRPNLALPIYSESSKTNPVEYVIVDQGYQVKYRKWGFSTQIDSMSAEITTNKTVNFKLGGLHSSTPTNSISIKLDDLLKIATLFREIDAGVLSSTTNSTDTFIDN